MTIQAEDLVIHLLSSFLSNDNATRLNAERAYTRLEELDSPRLTSILLQIIDHEPKSVECMIALCKLNRQLLTSEKVRAQYLSVFSREDYPGQIKGYVFSAIEEFLFVTDGDQTVWPELFPFFLKLLETDVFYGISFFKVLMQIKETDEFNFIVSEKLDFESPDINVRCVSLEFAMTSIFNSPVVSDVISDFPRLLATLPAPHFSRVFGYGWKTMKRHPSLFEPILIEIVSVLLSLSADRGQPELQRRDALFFLGKLISRFPELGDVVRATTDTVVRFLLPSLENPNVAPDLYTEAQAILALLPDAQPPEGANSYIASCFPAPDGALVDWLASNDDFLIANALQMIETAEPSDAVGTVLLAGASVRWSDFGRPLTTWCQRAPGLSTYASAVLGILAGRSDDGDALICEAAVRAHMGDGAEGICDRITDLIGKGKTDERALEALAIVAPSITPERLSQIIPLVLSTPALVTSVEFCLFLVALGGRFAEFIPQTVDALIEIGGQELASAVDVLQNLVDLFGSAVDANRICDFAFRFGDSLDVLQLLKSVLPFATERTDEVAAFLCQRIEVENDIGINEVLLTMAATVAEVANRKIALQLLGLVPVTVAKAVDREADELFAVAAALFQVIWKRFPWEATQLFFRLHRVFPKYSQTNEASSLRNFSLMMWTDFVIYGPGEHTAQFRQQIADDLKRMIIEEGDEVRVVAIACCASLFTAQSNGDVGDILKLFRRVLKEDKISEDVREAALSAFAQLLKKDLTEVNFPVRTQQLLSHLPLRKGSDEADAIYGNVYEMALFGAENPELVPYLAAYRDALRIAIDQRLVTKSFVTALRGRIDGGPSQLQAYIRELF
jgi:hypothetical protein